MNDAVAPQFDLTPPSKDELRGLVSDLSEDERNVLLEHGTELPFCGVFLDEKRQVVYTCRLCGLSLFKAGAKFESGTRTNSAGALPRARHWIADGKCGLIGVCVGPSPKPTSAARDDVLDNITLH